MTEKTVKRGYVRWEDENGFHKEPLADHPELLASASPKEQLRAEEARRLNAAAEEYLEEAAESEEDAAKEALVELKKAPEDVLTADQLVDEEVPASGAEEPAAAKVEVKRDEVSKD